MKITLHLLTDNGIEQKEYDIRGAKYSGELLALDIVGIGWRAIEKKEYTSYEIREA